MEWIDGKIKPEEGKKICAFTLGYPAAWQVGHVEGDDMVVDDFALNKRDFRFGTKFIKFYIYLPEKPFTWED